jgi:hypothetical protein
MDLIELVQAITGAVPIIEGPVPLQAADDVEAQVFNLLAEFGRSEPGVHEQVTGRKALPPSGLEHL